MDTVNFDQIAGALQEAEEACNARGNHTGDVLFIDLGKALSAAQTAFDNLSIRVQHLEQRLDRTE